MYKFSIKASLPRIETVMDKLWKEPYVILKDPIVARNLGVYAKPLRKNKILHISQDKRTKETIAVLKRKPVQKKRGRKVDYIFEDTFLPKIDDI